MPLQADRDEWQYKISGGKSAGSSFLSGNTTRLSHTLHELRSLNTAPETRPLCTYTARTALLTNVDMQKKPCKNMSDGCGVQCRVCSQAGWPQQAAAAEQLPEGRSRRALCCACPAQAAALPNILPHSCGTNPVTASAALVTHV